MLGQMLDQDAEVGYIVAVRIVSGWFISVPECSIDEEEVVSRRQILLMMNDTRMVKWHDAEHAATVLEHPAFDGTVWTGYPSHLADNVPSIGFDRVGEVD
jgi:hypothetical protein